MTTKSGARNECCRTKKASGYHEQWCRTRRAEATAESPPEEQSDAPSTEEPSPPAIVLKKHTVDVRELVSMTAPGAVKLYVQVGEDRFEVPGVAQLGTAIVVTAVIVEPVLPSADDSENGIQG